MTSYIHLNHPKVTRELLFYLSSVRFSVATERVSLLTIERGRHGRSTSASSRSERCWACLLCCGGEGLAVSPSVVAAAAATAARLAFALLALLLLLLNAGRSLSSASPCAVIIKCISVLSFYVSFT